MKFYILFCLFLLGSCQKENKVFSQIQSPDEEVSIALTRDRIDSLLVSTNIFEISYNEIYEQPNWVKYIVRDIVKNADRDGMNFYTVDSIYTSDNEDYYSNRWDKGHMAPAGSFTDSWSNLAKTFSFVNCALQKDNLNRGEWRELEEQVRDWARDIGPVNVRIELKFSPESQVLPTGATVPDGFYKFLTFSDNFKKCYYLFFSNFNFTSKLF